MSPPGPPLPTGLVSMYQPAQYKISGSTFFYFSISFFLLKDLYVTYILYHLTLGTPFFLLCKPLKRVTHVCRTVFIT